MEKLHQTKNYLTLYYEYMYYISIVHRAFISVAAGVLYIYSYIILIIE